MKFNLPMVVALALCSAVLPATAQDLDYSAQRGPWDTSTAVNEVPTQRPVRITASQFIQGCNAGLIRLPGGFKCKSLALVSEGGLVADPVPDYYAGGGGGGGRATGCNSCGGAVTSGDGSPVSSGSDGQGTTSSSSD